MAKRLAEFIVNRPTGDDEFCGRGIRVKMCFKRDIFDNLSLFEDWEAGYYGN